VFVELTDAACGQCRIAGDPQRLEILAGLSGGSLLQRCRACGTLWFENIRWSKPISKLEARELFPDIDIG
jgi:uncharacterized Zn finger protein